MNTSEIYTRDQVSCVNSIIVINVRKKIKKTLTNAFFYPKNKKTFVNVIKNVTLFLLVFDVEPVDKTTDIN